MTWANRSLVVGIALAAMLVPAVVRAEGDVASRQAQVGGQMADEAGGIAMELAVKAVTWLSSHANGILATAYERAPVLVTVLAALLILPVTALAALLAQSMRVRHANRLKPVTRPPRRTPDPAPLPPIQPLAWLRQASGQRTPLPPALALVRIGRHEDNDIRLDQTTVHRHHAIIHRTPDADFVITDVSGEAGNGVVVNGQRLTERRLASGDTIQLGEAALIFECTLPAFLAQQPFSSHAFTSPTFTTQPRTSPTTSSQTPSHGG